MFKAFPARMGGLGLPLPQSTEIIIIILLAVAANV